MLLIGKPVPTFPEALFIHRASHRKTGSHFSGSTVYPSCFSSENWFPLFRKHSRDPHANGHAWHDDCLRCRRHAGRYGAGPDPCHQSCAGELRSRAGAGVHSAQLDEPWRSAHARDGIEHPGRHGRRGGAAGDDGEAARLLRTQHRHRQQTLSRSDRNAGGAGPARGQPRGVHQQNGKPEPQTHLGAGDLSQLFRHLRARYVFSEQATPRPSHRDGQSRERRCATRGDGRGQRSRHHDRQGGEDPDRCRVVRLYRRRAGEPPPGGVDRQFCRPAGRHRGCPARSPPSRN